MTAEMAGRFSSIVFGIVNMMGNGAGFLVPQVMGKILNDTDQGNPESWTYVFGIPCKSNFLELIPKITAV